MGYLVCENCKGYYKLKKGESAEDFSKCECDGNFKYYDDVADFIEETITLEQKICEYELIFDDLEDNYAKLNSENNYLDEDYPLLNTVRKEKLDEENSKLKIEKIHLKDDFSYIEGDYSRLLEENRKLKEINTDLSKFESDYINLKSKYSDLIIIKENLDIENSQLNIENSQLNESNAVLISENSKLSEIGSEWEEMYSKLVLNNENLKNKYSDLLITNNSLDKENSKLLIEKIEWEDKYLALEYSNWDIFFKLESENRSLKENYSLLNSFLKSEYRNLGDNFIRLDESISLINEDESRLEEGNTNLSKILSNLEGGYTKFISPYENLKSYFDLSSEEELTGDDSNLLDENFSYIKWDNSKLKEENKKLKNLNAELNAKSSKFKSENIDLKKKYSNFKDESSEFKKDENKFKDSDYEKEDLNSDDIKKNNFITFIYDDIYGFKVNVKSVIELKNQLNNRKIKNSDSNSMVHISKLDLKSFRKCTECGRVLPVIKFSKNNSSADGYVDFCKDCDKKK